MITYQTKFRFSETHRNQKVPFKTYTITAGEFICWVKNKYTPELDVSNIDIEKNFWMEDIERQLQVCVSYEEDRIGVSIEYEEVKDA